MHGENKNSSLSTASVCSLSKASVKTERDSQVRETSVSEDGLQPIKSCKRESDSKTNFELIPFNLVHTFTW
jgi:hypothetical protein